MPTVDDLRTALNDLATDTPGLSSELMLRQGKRLRTRRRLFATGGVLALAGVAAVLFQFGGGPRAVPAGPRPSTAVTTDVVAIDQLFEITAEREAEPGVFTRGFTYLGFPAETRFQARCELSRHTPDSKRLPGTYPTSGKPTSWVLRGGVRVTASEEPSGEGTARFFKWTYRTSQYFMTCDPYDRKSDTPTALPHGPSDNELFALLEWINEH
ncbi:hypothetical protein [Actinoplanes sp. NPDC049265]|uniref:hypothetical protein n=1 Tax=Actinoplanes sp. NPDC049265 TaxID=3363902 RepID=UPI00371D5487